MTSRTRLLTAALRARRIPTADAQRLAAAEQRRRSATEERRRRIAVAAYGLAQWRRG